MSSSRDNNLLLPRDLSIIWSDDTRYWRKPSNDGEPAELLGVCWLEVTGSSPVKPGKTYEVGFQVSMTEEAYGWNGLPVYIMAKIGEKGKYYLRRAALDKLGPEPVEIPEQRITITARQDGRLYFGMYEVWSGRWKGGLKIHAAFVREVLSSVSGSVGG